MAEECACKRSARSEDDEREDEPSLARIEAGSDEAPHLIGHKRRCQQDAAEKGKVHIKRQSLTKPRHDETGARWQHPERRAEHKIGDAIDERKRNHHSDCKRDA